MRAPMTWQSIETAPRDGRAILVWQPDRTEPHTWAPAEGGPKQTYDDPRYAIGYWRPWGGWGNRNHATNEPTHWMPLPKPPVAETMEEADD